MEHLSFEPISNAELRGGVEVEVLDMSAVCQVASRTAVAGRDADATISIRRF